MPLFVLCRIYPPNYQDTNNKPPTGDPPVPKVPLRESRKHYSTVRNNSSNCSKPAVKPSLKPIFRFVSRLGLRPPRFRPPPLVKQFRCRPCAPDEWQPALEFALHLYRVVFLVHGKVK